MIQPNSKMIRNDLVRTMLIPGLFEGPHLTEAGKDKSIFLLLTVGNVRWKTPETPEKSKALIHTGP